MRVRVRVRGCVCPRRSVRTYGLCIYKRSLKGCVLIGCVLIGCVKGVY